MHKNKRGVKEISEKLNLSEKEICDFLNVVPKHKKEEHVKKTKFEIFENLNPELHKQNWSGNKILTFGLMGDTQFNSKYSQVTYLNRYYDECVKQQVKTVYHTGDIDDGECMHPGHTYDNYTQGGDEHIAEIIKNYPSRKGLVTKFITGNHDASIYKKCGMDIGKSISDRREDLIYLGRDWAKVELTPNCILELRHPWDGTAYALSYKMQKMVEAMEADSKPNILAVGHYHKLEYLFYRNIHCFQTGCFQSQTPFTRGKSIGVHIGGWIVTIEVNSKGHILRIVPELIPFYRGIIDDYKNWK